MTIVRQGQEKAGTNGAAKQVAVGAAAKTGRARLLHARPCVRASNAQQHSMPYSAPHSLAEGAPAQRAAPAGRVGARRPARGTALQQAEYEL